MGECRLKRGRSQLGKTKESAIEIIGVKLTFLNQDRGCRRGKASEPFCEGVADGQGDFLDLMPVLLMATVFYSLSVLYR